MWLILCDSNDASALWAYEQFVMRGYGPVELILDEQLAAFATGWEHRLGVEGVYTKMQLSDGRVIQHDQVKGVLNRILFVPDEQLQFIQEDDHPYIREELNAFFLSWLYSFPGSLLNRSTPYGLSGQHRHISEWVWLAGQSGLPVTPYQQNSRDAVHGTFTHPRLQQPEGTYVRNLFAVDGQVADESVPISIRQSCTQLAERCKTRLLGIDFFVDHTQQWTFAGATTYPRFQNGGEVVIGQLAKALHLI